MDFNTIIYPTLSLGCLGIIFGVLLGYASKKFAVEVDPKVPLVRDALPGANCGGCGYAGCDALAKAIVEGDAKPNGCPVGGAACAQAIAEIMGITVDVGEKKTAFVMCNGTCDKSKNKYEYYGITDCRDAALIPGGGSKGCSFGCLGLGSCVKACAFDAIHVVNGVAIVDEEKCTSCGMCAAACPKQLIEMVPESKKVRVMCKSFDNGKDVRANCSVGCIGCKMCERACEFDAVHVNNNLAKIDYEKCTQCNACAQKCPTKAIKGVLVQKSEAV